MKKTILVLIIALHLATSCGRNVETKDNIRYFTSSTIALLDGDTTYLSYAKYNAEDLFITNEYLIANEHFINNSKYQISPTRPIKSIIIKRKHCASAKVYDSYSKIFFNYLDNKIVELEYNFAGEVKEAIVTTYNADGLDISRIHYDHNGVILKGRYTEIKPLEHIEKDLQSGKINNVKRYDNQGNMTALIFSNFDKTPDHQDGWFSEYDKNGREIRCLYYPGSYIDSSEDFYEYDSLGRLIKESRISYGEEEPSYFVYYEYDEQGNQIALRRRYKGEESYDLEVLSTYQRGKLIRERTYHDGELYADDVFAYDSYGNMTRKRDYDPNDRKSYCEFYYEIKYF